MTATEHPSIKKFLFDRSFDQAAPARADKAGDPNRAVMVTREDLEKLRNSGYQEGHTAGMAEACDQTQNKTAQLLTSIQKQLDTTFANLVQHQKQMHADSVEMAVAVARKLMPEFIEKHGLEEVKALIEKSLAELAREPRLVIRVAENQFDIVNGMIEKITKERAFAGKVVLLAEPALGVSDCRIEWADGGMERDLNQLWGDIDQAVAKARQAVPALQTSKLGMTPTPSTDVAV